MDKSIRQFIEKAKNVCLQEQEKQALLSELFLRMQAHSALSKKGLMKTKGFRESFFNIFISALQAHALPIVAGVLVVVLASAGGISFSAEQTAPGEFLYPIKIGVNEKLFTAFAVAPEKKAAWSVQQTERRLVE